MDARDFFGYKHPDEEPGRRVEEADADERVPTFDEAITLDDPAALQRIDPADMLGKVAELPRQLAQARRVAAATELEDRHRDVDAIVNPRAGAPLAASSVRGRSSSGQATPARRSRRFPASGLPASAGCRWWR